MPCVCCQDVVLQSRHHGDPIPPAGKALRKLVMQTRANSVAWNPMEAFNFTAASEDCNLYSYDMRKLASATCVHQVHAGRRTPSAYTYIQWVPKAQEQGCETAAA